MCRKLKSNHQKYGNTTEKYKKHKLQCLWETKNPQSDLKFWISLTTYHKISQCTTATTKYVRAEVPELYVHYQKYTISQRFRLQTNMHQSDAQICQQKLWFANYEKCRKMKNCREIYTTQKHEKQVKTTKYFEYHLQVCWLRGKHKSHRPVDYNLISR